MAKTAPDYLSFLKKNKTISQLDFHFARLMERLSGNKNPLLSLASALVSHFSGMGHICLDLSTVAEKPCLADNEKGSFYYPPLSYWLDELISCPVVGKAGDFKPLILENSRLYLQRHWVYEKQIVDSILERAQAEIKGIDFELLKNGLDRLFPPGGANESDWQKLASLTAVKKRLCVISGGPGTGKTTTVVKILALLLEQGKGQNIAIGLTAPTGKAAIRLKEAILMAKTELDCPDHIKKAIPGEISTIHRLLGTIPNSPYFRHNTKNPLPLDILVLDEASLVDMPLMAKLTQALKPDTRLILLGDHHQLASVEPGSVLGDIAGRENPLSANSHIPEKPGSITEGGAQGNSPSNNSQGVRDCIIELKKNYRFKKGSGIGDLSLAVKEGRGEEALKIIKDECFTNLKWREAPKPRDLRKLLEQKVTLDFKALPDIDNPGMAFSLLARSKILCAFRNGPFGVNSVNKLAEDVLAKAGLIAPEKGWYRGRPVIITRNDYRLALFNGDMGMALPEAGKGGVLRVCFLGDGGTFKKVLPQALSEHETAYALTVHKSQGSEFDNVLLLLSDTPAPILTRELIYTGITRAKNEVEIWGREEVFINAVSRKIERTSGLEEKLFHY